jgi:hypothetical protein
MGDLKSVFVLVLAIVFVTFLLIAIPKFDRQRIREHIEMHGGKVIEILRAWFGGGRGRNARAYEVTYMTRQGERITATCITNMMSGVQWLSDKPPGTSGEGVETGEETEPSADSETIDCVQCGAKIPAGVTRCPQCGWSYRGN